MDAFDPLLTGCLQHVEGSLYVDLPEGSRLVNALVNRYQGRYVTHQVAPSYGFPTDVGIAYITPFKLDLLVLDELLQVFEVTLQAEAANFEARGKNPLD